MQQINYVYHTFQNNDISNFAILLLHMVICVKALIPGLVLLGRDRNFNELNLGSDLWVIGHISLTGIVKSQALPFCIFWGEEHLANE